MLHHMSFKQLWAPAKSRMNAVIHSRPAILAMLPALLLILGGTGGGVFAAQDSETIVYLTRHWEKKDSYTIEVPDGEELVIPMELSELGNVVPSDYRELSALGVVKADLFPDWLAEEGIEPTHFISTQKNRTFFSLRPASVDLGVPIDLVHDPECALPNERIYPEETPDLLGLNEQVGVACRSNSFTLVPTLDAIYELGPGDVAVVSQHSGNLWGLITGMLGHPPLEGPPFDLDELEELGFAPRDPGDDRDPIASGFAHIWKLKYSKDEWNLDDIIRVDLDGFSELKEDKKGEKEQPRSPPT